MARRLCVLRGQALEQAAKSRVRREDSQQKWRRRQQQQQPKKTLRGGDTGVGMLLAKRRGQEGAGA